jgi:hypothetical protein
MPGLGARGKMLGLPESRCFARVGEIPKYFLNQFARLQVAGIALVQINALEIVGGLSLAGGYCPAALAARC